MAAVKTDVFWHLVKGLREVNNAAVSVPPFDKIINDAVLVAFTNKIIKNNYFLVVHRKLFECSGAGFLKIDRFYQTLTKNKSYSVICLFCQNYWVHKLASGKNRLACKGGLACSYSWKNLGQNFQTSLFGGVFIYQRWKKCQ